MTKKMSLFTKTSKVISLKFYYVIYKNIAYIYNCSKQEFPFFLCEKNEH